MIRSIVNVYKVSTLELNYTGKRILEINKNIFWIKDIFVDIQGVHYKTTLDEDDLKI